MKSPRAVRPRGLLTQSEQDNLFWADAQGQRTGMTKDDVNRQNDVEGGVQTTLTGGQLSLAVTGRLTIEPASAGPIRI